MKDKILDKIKDIHDTILVPSVDEKPKECLNGMRQLNLITELRGLVEGLNIPDVVKSCDHEWVMTHSGHCRDCVKCGRKE